jgi:hypothetical protein
MTVPAIRAVGFCPHLSSQAGEWAFDYALSLARSSDLQLDILLFLTDPFASPREPAPPRERRRGLAVDLEREARLYFEDKLGDYLSVGCRVCEGEEWHELHKCLSRHEFQVLVLPYPKPGALFAGTPIEQFANALVCPVVLVGPSAPNELRLNGPASLLADRLHVPSAPPPPQHPSWHRIGEEGGRGEILARSPSRS